MDFISQHAVNLYFKSTYTTKSGCVLNSTANVTLSAVMSPSDEIFMRTILCCKRCRYRVSSVQHVNSEVTDVLESLQSFDVVYTSVAFLSKLRLNLKNSAVGFFFLVSSDSVLCPLSYLLYFLLSSSILHFDLRVEVKSFSLITKGQCVVEAKVVIGGILPHIRNEGEEKNNRVELFQLILCWVFFFFFAVSGVCTFCKPAGMTKLMV